MAAASKAVSQTFMEAMVAHIDGASRGNPGPASYGVVIRDEHGHTLDTLSRFLGKTTNNFAEYSALLAALEYARSKQARRVKIYCDSELVARQMQGRYRVQSRDLRPLYERARALANQFSHFAIEHVRREQNREADLLANKALDLAANDRGAQEAAERRKRGPEGGQMFCAIVEEGKLKPLSAVPELEEGAEYDVHITKRHSRDLDR